MYGFIGFLALFVVLQQLWEQGAAFAAAMIARGGHDVEAVEPGARVEALADRAGEGAALGDRGRGAEAAEAQEAQVRRALHQLALHRRATPAPAVVIPSTPMEEGDPQFESGTGLTTLFEGEWATVRRLRKGKLVVVNGPDQGKEIEISKPRVTVH